MISVIIPVHNRSSYLKIALESVYRQEGVQFEIIVVDDNSTEDLTPIINHYQCVYIKNKENRGAQYSRNIGAKIAKYPYIAFLDSDDIWHCHNKLKYQYDVISKDSKVSLVFTPLRYINETGEIIQEALCSSEIVLFKDALGSMLSKDFIATYSSVLMRKKDFFAVGGCDENLPARQDWDLWIRLAEKGTIVKDARTSISYRMHSSQISSSGEKKLIGYLSILEKHFSKYHFNFKTIIAYYENILKVALLIGFIRYPEDSQLPYRDKLLMKYFSKISFISKVPLLGGLFIKILGNTYLFKGVTIE